MTPADAELVKRLRNKLPALGASENGIPSPITEQAADCIEAQSAEIARLREALRPFAMWAHAFDQHDHGDEKRLHGCHATVGDLRRARAALEPKG